MIAFPKRERRHEAYPSETIRYAAQDPVWAHFFEVLCCHLAKQHTDCAACDRVRDDLAAFRAELARNPRHYEACRDFLMAYNDAREP